MRVAIVALACLLASGALGDRETDDIREATFRYEFEKNSSAQQKAAKVYCLSLDGQEPSDDFNVMHWIS